MQRVFEMDGDTAQNQVALITEAYDALNQSRGTLADLADGQTVTVWTSDGKSVPLAAELAAKYRAALKWRDAIEENLRAAAENIRLAITETTQLNEAQKSRYYAQLDAVLGQNSREA
ncbi:hypothetical protein [Microbacterium foliorum]|nr:hypothetical protein [Microbacterium foliorum]